MSLTDLINKIFRQGSYTLKINLYDYDTFEEIIKNIPEDFFQKNKKNILKTTKNFLDKNGRRIINMRKKDITADSLYQLIISEEYLKKEEIMFEISDPKDLIYFLTTIGENVFYGEFYKDNKWNKDYEKIIKNLFPEEVANEILIRENLNGVLDVIISYLNSMEEVKGEKESNIENIKQKNVSKKIQNVEIIKPKEQTNINNILEKINPKAIKSYLDGYIINQDKAKSLISIFTYKFIKGIIKNKPIRNNIWLIGYPGTGKTYLIKKVADYLTDVFGDFPFVEVDITQYTSTGYVGKSISDILYKLQSKKNLNNGAIVFIDEIDKIAESKDRSPIVDVGVQEELLKFIEGSEDLQQNDDFYYGEPTQNKKNIDPNKIWFILAGSFYNIIRKKTIKSQKMIGFERKDSTKTVSYVYHHQIKPQDLINYGMIPELIRRVPNIIQLSELDVKDFYNIMKNAKDNALERYLNSIKDIYSTEIDIGDELIDYIAKRAATLNLGASGIETVINRLFIPLEEILLTQEYKKLKFNSFYDLLNFYKGHKIEIYEV